MFLDNDIQVLQDTTCKHWNFHQSQGQLSEKSICSIHQDSILRGMLDTLDRFCHATGIIGGKVKK